MRTDAMLFNMAGANGGAKRMDHRKTNQKSFSMEFGVQRKNDSINSRFQDAYKQVAANNIRSQKKSDSITNKASEEDNAVADNDLHLRTSQDIFSGMDISAETPGVKSDLKKERIEDATEIIKDALSLISDILQLNIAQGLDDISLEDVSEETVDQFTEIVVALKNIISILDSSSQTESGSDLLIPNMEQPEKAAAILRTELFKIEMGMQVLGFGERVQLNVAEKMALPANNGIPQAVDPSTLSMAQEDMKRIFGDLIQVSDENLSMLTRKVKELVNENASDKSFSVSVENVSSKKEQEFNIFDSKMYRALFKLEKMEVVEQENKDAAEENNAFTMLNGSEPVLASDLKDAAESQKELLPVVDIGAKAVPNHQEQILQTKISNSLSRTLESSVVNQVSEKLNGAVRSGINEIRIQLRPESLGEVKLSIRMDGDIVIAKINVENQQVKQIIESNLQSLKDSLAEHNLQAGSFDVNVGDGWNRQQDAQQWSDVQRQSGENGPAETITNEVDHAGNIPGGVETGRRFGDNSIEFFA